MDLKELLSRKSSYIYTVEEACFVVQEYIYSVTKQRVVIDLAKTIDPRLPKNHPMYHMLMTIQLRLLFDAFVKACERIKLDE